MIKDNQKLKALFEADQQERTDTNLDWLHISINDVKRQALVLTMIERGQVKTPTDYYHAAMVFQHATTLEGIQRAQQLARIAMDGGEDRAKWLYAAATDRLLVRMNKKQKYGTQYLQTVVVTKKGTVKREWVLHPYEEKTTDAMRKKYNVPSLKELKKHAKEMS